MKLANYFFSQFLEKREQIKHVVHKSFIVVLVDILRILVIGFVLPAAVYFFFNQLLVVSVVWMVFGVIRLLLCLYTWYYDSWIITDRGVIDVQSSGLFDISATRIEYHMIEGVSYAISGFWATVLRYGDLSLEKLGSGNPIILHSASSPVHAENVLLKNQEKYMESRTMQDHKTLRELLSGMVREHAKSYGVPEVDE